MSISPAAVVTTLVEGRNRDGGWAYSRGKASRLEATAWAALALRGTPTQSSALEAIQQWPTEKGLLLEHAGGVPNYAFHALALLALLSEKAEHAAGNAALVAALLRVKGLTFERQPISTQDNMLEGWSWIAETASWVEPTAWSLLALKKAHGQGIAIDAARVDQAERLLVNRRCASGGWNYGNADILGQDLRPYVPTTAIGLMAMQDRLDTPDIALSVAYLDSHATSELSGQALALALMALGLCRRPTASVRAALERQLSTTLELGNQATIASALFALRFEEVNGSFAL